MTAISLLMGGPKDRSLSVINATTSVLTPLIGQYFIKGGPVVNGVCSTLALKKGNTTAPNGWTSFAYMDNAGTVNEVAGIATGYAAGVGGGSAQNMAMSGIVFNTNGVAIATYDWTIGSIHMGYLVSTDYGVTWTAYPTGLTAINSAFSSLNVSLSVSPYRGPFLFNGYCVLVSMAASGASNTPKMLSASMASGSITFIDQTAAFNTYVNSIGFVQTSIPAAAYWGLTAKNNCVLFVLGQQTGVSSTARVVYTSNVSTSTPTFSVSSSWDTVWSTSSVSMQLYSVATNGSIIVAYGLGNPGYITTVSYDGGVTWTAGNTTLSALLGSPAGIQIGWVQNRFVAHSGNPNGYMSESPDGVTWSTQYPANASLSTLSNILIASCDTFGAIVNANSNSTLTRAALTTQ
jgi:hypothetical protein